jgi:hypothetical protein
MSDPSGQWVSGSQQKDRGFSKGVNESDPKWDDFLMYLSSKNKVMFKILKDWHFLKLT